MYPMNINAAGISVRANPEVFQTNGTPINARLESAALGEPIQRCATTTVAITARNIETVAILMPKGVWCVKGANKPCTTAYNGPGALLVGYRKYSNESPISLRSAIVGTWNCSSYMSRRQQRQSYYLNSPLRGRYQTIEEQWTTPFYC